MNIEKLKQIQALTRKCSKVYIVMVSCDGEDSIECVWADEATARRDADHINSLRPRCGTARVVPMPVRTAEIGRLLYEEHAVQAGG